MKRPGHRPPPGVDAHDMDVQGVRTRVYEVDPGTALTPLVLLHGAGADSALVSFGSALASLGARRRVIAPDLPGYGDTQFTDASYSIPWYADWVAALIHRLGLDRVDLAGLSLGGWITLEVAISRPEIVRRIVPVNPGGVTETFKYLHLARWLANHPAVNKQAYHAYARLGRRFTRMQLRRIVEHPAALSDDLVDAVILNCRSPHAGEAFSATQRWTFGLGPRGWSLVSRLPQVRAKTLVIAGRDDRLVPVADSVRASQLVQDGEVRIFEPCGHWLVRDCPEEFVEAVSRFLG
ncbi:alpha/beta fold hydrolase [Mycobacterium sp. Marseille-P9652]|uniref:alpha/beta fold hydrolase n=1 Tax=Mycobacterium sp. Marseille-P9652 TaxID=2654950 RepID=UPI0012E79EB1|nr:alpha/beta hydrolase [Mycobacterium sp. Marseille-P9652]